MLLVALALSADAAASKKGSTKKTNTTVIAKNNKREGNLILFSVLFTYFNLVLIKIVKNISEIKANTKKEKKQCPNK